MSKDLIVVGLGSSAGGLEALQIMLKNLPQIDNCSYIIAQHLSPTHKSMMVELLSRNTNLPVIEVKNGMLIKKKTIYMTPENTDIYVKDSKMYLKNIEQSFGPKPSVNYFFSSLASDFNERAIGIILSGTGSDGSYGIRAIKAEGGMTMAQAPNTAKYDGMPLSAINTGKVDLVVPIDKISQEIERIVYSLDNESGISLNERILQQIYRLIFDEFGVDFSLYKKNTIVRRIERRLAALKMQSLSTYLETLKASKEEISNLYHDILIGVTSFFRDKESFEELKKYIETIISKKEQGEELRFWSIGCSTGEEAYSIGIILSEILKEKISKYKIKIFATDIDDESLKIARMGVYSETSLTGVDKKLIQRYFSVQKNHFEIKKQIRELVVFSRHNIVADSPFLRLDLISCRNMLIYFNQNLQNRFFSIVHYSLRDNAYLFLGKSESVGQHLDLFSIVDKNAKIFKAQYTGIKEAPRLYNYSNTYKNYEEPKLKKYKNEEEILEDKVSEALRQILFSQCVVINSSNDVLYIKGKIPYLKFSEGRITNNIFKLIEDDLSLDLRSCINEASKTKKLQLTPFKAINVFEDIIRYVRIIVVPLKDENTEDWMNILFFQSEDTQNIKGQIIQNEDESEVIAKLSLELSSTKSHLQNVIEELETSYEEMQGLNEELQSSNEELQSTNEELETTNEELQSTNEELQTAYSELRVLYDDKEKRAKQLEDLMEKLSTKNEDYRKQKEITEAIIDSATICIIMVNEEGEITFANKQSEQLFGLSKQDILNKKYSSNDWCIQDFEGKNLKDEDLPFSIIKRTYESIHDIKHLVKTQYSKLYLSVSGAPLFDVEGRFKGAVFCIEDLTVSQLMKNDLQNIENDSIKLVKTYKNENSFDMLEMAILDLSSHIRNTLSDISITVDSMGNNSDIQSKKDLINKSIKEFTSNLDTDFMDFYLNKLKYKTVNVIDEINSFIKIFDLLIKNSMLELQMDISSSVNIQRNTDNLRKSLFFIFEFLLSVKQIYLFDMSTKLYIKVYEQEQKHYIEFVLDGKKLLKSKTDITENYEDGLKVLLLQEGFSSKLLLEEKFILKVEF